jgi:hypothetical protein
MAFDEGAARTEVVTVVGGDNGTYTVNSDCTGSFTDSTDGLDFNTVIVNGGAELFAIQSDTGTCRCYRPRRSSRETVLTEITKAVGWLVG